jgi:hypothetical protein
MDWKRVAGQAKQMIDKRGGSESLKEDADELRDIAEGPGTLSEKAKRAAEALREPGAHREPGEPEGSMSEPERPMGEPEGSMGEPEGSMGEPDPSTADPGEEDPSGEDG